jgi:hypothetical protein
VPPTTQPTATSTQSGRPRLDAGRSTLAHTGRPLEAIALVGVAFAVVGGTILLVVWRRQQ